ncbi:MAG: recombinase RecA [Dehalococcoidia bacterium]|nr:MAG: recombinase RecA [Dehalococcoidia bacterium]
MGRPQKKVQAKKQQKKLVAKKAVKKETEKKTTTKKKNDSFLNSLITETGNSYATTGEDIKNISFWYDTGSYVLNGIISGDLFKGYPSGRTTALAGEESTGKTFYALTAVEIFLRDNPTGICIFFKSENAITKDMLTERGIDINRIAFLPVYTVENFRNQICKILTKYIETPKSKRVPMFCVLDSLGQLSTTKELADTVKDKTNADMGSRAKAIKSAFRVIEGQLEFADVPLILTNHTYNSMGLFPTQEVACVVSGTKILSLDGYKNIENIVEGDKVLTRLRTFESVLETHRFKDKNIVEIEMENGFIIKCTKEHKFMIDGEWVDVNDLKPGDNLEQIPFSVHPGRGYGLKY